MGNNIIEQAKVSVALDGRDAETVIQELTNKTNQYTDALVKAYQAGDKVGMKNALKDLKETERNLKQVQKQTFDVTKVMKDLNGTSLNELKRAHQEISKELGNMTRGTKEYADKSKDLQRVSGEISKVKTEMNGISSGGNMFERGWGKITGVFGKLIPVLGAAWGSIKIGESIIKSAQATSDEWEKTVEGLKSGWEFLKKSIATMDFSNFLTNMREAIQAGRDYADTLDELADRNRALKIQEADARRYILDRMKIVRDATKTSEEQFKAGHEIIAKEDELAKNRTANAKKTFDSELKLRATQYKLSEEELMNYMTNYNQIKANIEQGEAYNLLLKERSQLSAAISSMAANGMDYEPQMKKLKQVNIEISNASEETKMWGKVVAGMGKSSDEELDHLVQLYKEFKDAENSAAENTGRLDARLSNIMAERGKREKKALDDKQKTIDKALEKEQEAYKESIKMLSQWGRDAENELVKINNEINEALADQINNANADTNEQYNQIQKNYEDQLNQAAEFINSVRNQTQSAEEQRLNDQLEAYQSARDNNFISEEQFQNVLDSVVIIRNANRVAKVADLASQGAQILQGIYDAESQAVEAKYDREFEALENQHDRGLISDAAYNAKKKELAEKQEKEEKKIKKRQANLEFVIQIASIISSTAQAIAKSVAISPATLGQPWATINGIIGAAQLAIAVFQKAKVAQAATGRYNVIGAQDNKSYSVPFAGDMNTGIYTRPVLVAERGPEVVIDNPTLRRIQINEPDIIPRIIRNRVYQYAEGNYPVLPGTNGTLSPENSRIEKALLNNNKALAQVSSINNALLFELQNGVRVNMEAFQNAQRDWNSRKNDITRK